MYVTRLNEHVSPQLIPQPVKTSTVTRLHRVAEGKHLFFEGEEAGNIYRVVSGVLRLTRLMEDGRRQVIAFGYPGDVVGFPSDGQYHTDCEALRPTTVVVHNRAALESSTGDAALHASLLQAALREISAMQDHFLMLGRKSACERVASFLCVLADRVGTPLGEFTQFDLPMSRSDIADFLGLTTETVCRTFTQLRKRNVIALDRIYTVILLKPRDLFALAEGEASCS